jgi:superfamily I DNA/RNA helicase
MELSLFPLERALNDGPVALSQEPRVFYVATSRATHNLYLLADAEGGEDADLETVLYEL